MSKTVTVRAAPANNAAPVFPSGSNARSVDENSPPGTKVGKPVIANDASGDTLTYTLSGGGATSFDIGQASGQITVGARTTLNREDTTLTDFTYTVTVTATDPAGGTAPQEVTITINDVNEAPKMTEGATRVSLAENTAITTMVGSYEATDPESTVSGNDCDMDNCTWSVSGMDAGDFDISNADATFGQLTFKKVPNYEKPADSNGDNVYMVTVVVTDKDAKKKLTAMRDVTITVTNAEEPGTVTLSTEQPKVGIELTSTLMDPDGVVADSVKWTWHSSADGTGTAIPMADSDTYTPKETGPLSAKASYTDGHGAVKSAVGTEANVVENTANVAPKFPDTETGVREVAENNNVDANVRVDADNPSTTNDPVNATDTAGETLTYTLSGTDSASFDIDRGTGQLKTKAALDYETKKSYMVTVTATDPDGLSASIDVTITVTNVDEAPMIMVGGLAISGMSSVSYAENRTDAVAEYTLAGPMKDRARWALEGDDASDFTLMNGTLRFKRSPNYEMPMDMGENNTYEVTIKANDGTYMGTRAVMVMVTNVDEIGTLSGPETVSYMEKGTDAVGTYTVSGGSMSAMANLTLMGDDAGDFMLMDDGMLKFSSPPNFEAPMDMDTDNTYMVTVKAEAGGEMDMMDVTVTVANEEEMGEVTLWASPTEELTMAPQVGETITGLVVDEDGGVTGQMWQWSRTMDTADMNSWMDIQDATAADYMVTAGDEGYYLRVMATYTDAAGTDMAYSMPTMMVGAVVDEPGMVTLWAGSDALTMAPQVGETITGLVVDPDGSVAGQMWQWARTMTPDMMDSWMDIDGATNAAYMVTAGDEDYHLRVTATYTDAVGTDMDTAYSMPTMMVIAEAEDTLLGRYDTDDNGIDLDEVFKAIDDYFDYDDRITLDEVYELVDLYFES